MAITPPTQKMDNPEFVLLSNGTELEVGGFIKSIKIIKSLSKIAEATIEMVDGDPATGEFKLSDGSDFNPGAEIEIQAGYEQQYETIFKGIVVKHRIKSSPSQHSTLQITLKNKAVKLTTARKSAVFMDKTDSDIISELMSNASVDATVESTDSTHEQMIQYNCSDWDFINLRADACGMLVITADDEVLIAPPDTGSETLELNYGSDIIDYEVEIDGRQSFGEYVGKFWSYADQEMAEEAPAGSTPAELGDLSASTISSDMGQDSLEVLNGALLSEKEMPALLGSYQMQGALAKIRGRARFMGIGGFEVGEVVKLNKLGKKFSGNALISGILHELAPGKWLTSVQFGLDGKRYANRYNDINDKPASGLLPGINGLQIGKVAQIEDDPEGEDRVLVKLPVANATEDAMWARVATLDAGNERGSFFRPEVDDEVILGFINDDPRNAVILGMLHSSSLPAPIKAAAENAEKGFVTREKIKLMFNDETKTVTIETPGGGIIQIDDENKVILIQDQNSNIVELSDSGISMETPKDFVLKATGDVTIEGMNIELVASANFSADGSGGVKLNSSAITEVKGSLIKLN